METKGKHIKNELVPNKSVGIFMLHDEISKYCELPHTKEHRNEKYYECDDYDFPLYDLTIWVENERIRSICCETSCYWKGKNLLRMNFKKFLETYGLQYDGKDEIILEIGKGYQTHKVYDFDELGLQIWVWRNLIRTVIVSNYQDE